MGQKRRKEEQLSLARNLERSERILLFRERRAYVTSVSRLETVRQPMDDKKSRNKKQLIKGTLIYAIGNLGTKIISFLIVPLYTYFILPADMGDYDIVITTVSLLTPLITMRISDAAYRWMLHKIDKDYKNNPDIKWNFTKFLVDRDGNVVKRFEPTADMKDVKAAVEALL